MDKPPSLKPQYWVGSSKRDLHSLPDPVEDLFGYALYLAQDGKKHEQAKPLKGFGSAGVLEVVEDWDRSTYRAVYTVRFESVVFVLHVFQKKSTRGAATPKTDIATERGFKLLNAAAFASAPSSRSVAHSETIHISQQSTLLKCGRR